MHHPQSVLESAKNVHFLCFLAFSISNNIFTVLPDTFYRIFGKRNLPVKPVKKIYRRMSIHEHLEHCEMKIGGDRGCKSYVVVRT